MKHSVLIIALLLSGIVSEASPHLASKQQVEMFLKSKTCVVLYNVTTSFDIFINNAVRKNWKITGYEFINEQEFEKRRFNPEYSFLVMMKEEYKNDPEGVSYNYLNLVLGDTARNLNDMPQLCSIPVSYTDSDIDYVYAVPAILNFMQKYVKTLQEKHLQIALFGLDYYNGKLKTGNKDLLLDEAALAENANTADKIKSVYHHPFKILNVSELRETLESNPANTVFNFHVGPGPGEAAGRCFDFIFDKEGNLYYYKTRKITNEDKDGFNLKNFSDIN